MTTTTSTVSTVGFRWMDILEKEFDKSFLAMDEILRTVSEDYETPDMYDVNRKLLSGLGSCFVQAVHKAQTIFQSNAKQEAELVHLREELAEAKATADRLDAEKQYLVCRLQSALLENHKHRHQQAENGNGSSSFSSSSSAAVEADTLLCSDIQSKLAKEMSVIERVDWEARKSEEKCRQLERENASLRRSQVELESELVGARLDSKYLDKELAGRIQQIQILLAGGGTSQEHKQKVWGQIEAEMHLQRSKTISNMCYSKQRVKESARAKSEEDTGSEVGLGSPRRRGSSSVGGYGGGGGRNRSMVKQVHIHKNDAEELGMAILGGREHGLPVMISEVFPNTAVGRCRKICAGDVILAVNGDSFDDMGHHEAVKYLSSLRGTIKFDLENRVDDEIEDVCDMGSRYYDMFDNDEESGEDEEARQRRIQQRSTQQRILLNHPGRAKEVQKKKNHGGDPSSPGSADRFKAMLPEVHSSPKKVGGGTAEKTVKQQQQNGRVA